LLFVAAAALALVSAPTRAADEGARAAATEAMLRAESLGPLRLGLPEKAVLKALGKPAKQTALVLQGADGNYVQEWHYPSQGIELMMSAGEKKSGAKTIATILAAPPCAFATRQGIKIGNPEAAARKAYAAHVDRDSPAEKGTFVAGSIYGGIIFNFAQGKVSRIFFGAAAE
jgi:hypothetical protein